MIADGQHLLPATVLHLRWIRPVLLHRRHAPALFEYVHRRNPRDHSWWSLRVRDEESHRDGATATDG
jgi:ribulose bisphosphate carboxylase small subunit